MFLNSPDKIAVITPVYNVTTYLADAIQSAVTQDYPQKEIIVIDDGSAADKAAEIEHICASFPSITLLKQAHSGTAVARDKGVKHTSADMVLFLDADDLLLPGALSYLAKTLHNTPDAIASYARSVAIDTQGNILPDRVSRPRQENTLKGTDVLAMLVERKDFIINGTICMRRDILNKIPPVNHGIKYDEDWVLLCHLALSGNIIPAGDRIIHHRRRHTESISASPADKEDFRFSELLKAYKAVYLHPAFIRKLGEDRLRRLFEKRIAKAHLRLAKHYMQSDLQKALFHFNSIPQPPSS